MNRSLFASLILALFLLIAGTATADVPGLLTYQGKLTNSSGQNVPNGTYTVLFSIYSDSSATMTIPLWVESHSITTVNGLFNVLLGTMDPLDESIFNGTIRYLGITVGANPEMTPRTPMVSVPYALAAGTATGSTLDCSSCETIFVNTTGPETITSTSDTTFRVINEHSSAKEALVARLSSNVAGPDSVAAVRGIAFNSNSAAVSGGSFAATTTGPSTVYGVKSFAGGATNWNNYGVFAQAENPGLGEALGGYFSAGSAGEGHHIGVLGQSLGNGPKYCAGVYGSAFQAGSGESYGGYFETVGFGGTGAGFGLKVWADGNTDTTIVGVWAKARNSGNGKTLGGYFEADSTGSSSYLTGCQGSAYGESQTCVGLRGEASNNSFVLHAIGVSGTASNFGSSSATGGSFIGRANGGMSVGVAGFSYGTSYVQSQSIGVLGSVSTGSVTTESTAGLFENYVTGGTQYGVHATAELLTGGFSAFGVNGRCGHTGSGNGYGGYFLSDSTGTGSSYGGRTVGLAKGSSTAYGFASYAANRGTGTVYGGYFSVGSYGSGVKYAIYASSPGTGYAGYFDGDVRVSENFIVLGSKNAAVNTSGNDYHLVYSQESPECWFEDFGEGQLINGRVHIELDPLYLETVTIDAANPMKVFIQLNDPDCNGTAVSRGTTGFDVVELMKGQGNASFSYRVVAKRRGYETVRLERMPGLTPDQVDEQVRQDAARLVEDDTRNAAPREAMGQKLLEATVAEAENR